MELKAQSAVETGQGFDAMVSQVMDQGDTNYKPNKQPNKLPHKPIFADTKLDPRQKAKMDWTRDARSCQTSINSDSQTFLNFMARGKDMAKDPLTGVTPQLITNMKSCYDTVPAQSKNITEHLLAGQQVDWVDWTDSENAKWTSKLDNIKAVVTKTNAIKDIGKRVIC